MLAQPLEPLVVAGHGLPQLPQHRLVAFQLLAPALLLLLLGQPLDDLLLRTRGLRRRRLDPCDLELQLLPARCPTDGVS
jgi:hypothetical protein